LRLESFAGIPREARSSPGGLRVLSNLMFLSQSNPRGEQPWAGGRNPLGIGPVIFHRGTDLSDRRVSKSDLRLTLLLSRRDRVCSRQC
jgi:hypothetical protein